MPTQQELEKDFFNDTEEVKNNFVKWGKEMDAIKGTLTSIRETTSQLPGKEGEKQKIYEIKVDKGYFHDIDDKTKQPVEPPVTLKKGEIWNVGGRAALDDQLRNVKLGQIIVIWYAETKPAKTKGFNPLKVLKVRVGLMDEQYVKENGLETLPF